MVPGTTNYERGFNNVNYRRLLEHIVQSLILLTLGILTAQTAQAKPGLCPSIRYELHRLSRGFPPPQQLSVNSF
ncbi:MAG: hypothetical protein GXP18_07715 [Gammaproteobacteria bacterium]|nr:hypothetical protein [Gammaproteobacteria bacterium]